MLIFLIVFMIVIYIVQDWSKKQVLKGIKYEYKFSKKLVAPDEQLQLISTITNESRRFAPFIRMEEVLPKGIQTLNKKVYIREGILGELKYNSSIYLMARSKLNRKLTVKFSQRGCYRFRGADLLGGDFLGLAEKRVEFRQFQEVVVYPKAIMSPRLQEIMGGFVGDISVRRFIMEDPILTLGAREYTGSEPLNQLSWKHTARTNKMMVKQFDYTTDMVVTVFLDISTVKGHTIETIEFENCFSLARSVCQYLNQKNISFEFVTNSQTERALSSLQQSIEGVGILHLRSIFEQLGRGTYRSVEPFEVTIHKLAKRQEKKRSTVIITPKRDVAKQRVAQELNKQGTTTLIFIYGSDFNDIYNRAETDL